MADRLDVRRFPRRSRNCQRLLTWPVSRVPRGGHPRKTGIERWFEFENMTETGFGITELAHATIAMRGHPGETIVAPVNHDGHVAWFVGVEDDGLARAQTFFADRLTPSKDGGHRWYTTDATRLSLAYKGEGMLAGLADRLVGWWMIHGEPAPWCLFTERNYAMQWLDHVQGETIRPRHR